jgi:hypothetical protein
MSVEVTGRCASGRTAAIALGQQVFRHRHLPLQAKVQVARSCVESRALHAAGTWPGLPPTLVAKGDTVLMRPLRHMMCTQLAVAEGEHRLSSAEVRRLLKAADVDAKLLAAKLQYAGRLSRHAPPYVLGLLQGRGGTAWRDDLTDAVALLQAASSPKLDELTPPHRPGAVAA